MFMYVFVLALTGGAVTAAAGAATAAAISQHGPG
jgi:hypothetical protein